MAHAIRSEDRQLLTWSREFSKKKIDMTLPRIRMQDYMQEDPERWIINATLNRLKSYAMQRYIDVGDDNAGADLLFLDGLEDLDDEYRERVNSEVDTSQFSFPTRDGSISTSTLSTAKSKPSGHDNRSIDVALPTTVAEYAELDTDADAGYYFREDDKFVERDRLIQKEIDKRVNEYLALEHPDYRYYSSTVKVFSDSSVANSSELYNETVELRKVEEVPVPSKTETLQEILLTPTPGPGFEMAQVAHPDAIFGPGRLLPSVYFLKPRVRIFSAFPRYQQFWCRQGNPIPVPPPSKRNTFFDFTLLSANHPKQKQFPFRVRSYKANMINFQADQLIFVVEGRKVFVTGEKRNREDKVTRRVTEEICLPIDLDLNYIRIARTNKGEVIFEELWEYDSKTKAN